MTTYDQHHDRVEGATKRHDAAVIARFVVIAALVVGLVLLALDNRDDVRIGYVFGDANAPICACFGLKYNDVVADVDEGTPTRIRGVVVRSKAGEAQCHALAADGRSCMAALQELYMRLRGGA